MSKLDTILDGIIDIFQEMQQVGKGTSDNIMFSAQCTIRLQNLSEKEFDAVIDELSNHWGDHENYVFEVDGMYYEDTITTRVIID